MRKTKRWELENCYYGSKTKFDRNYIKNYEGSRLPIHRFRDRRNWRGHMAWVPSKYLEGLLQKYLNKPIEALEEAFNRRAKDIKNHEPFKEVYALKIYGLTNPKYSRHNSKYYKYTIVDGILIKNPEYTDFKYHGPVRLKGYQVKYNIRHIKNPGEIREYPIKEVAFYTANSSMKDLRPIYLGKLYVVLNNKIQFMDVYHYSKAYPYWKLDHDPKYKHKQEVFEKDWKQVDIGIYHLDYFKEEVNPDYAHYLQISESDAHSESVKDIAKERLLHTEPIVINNYGLGKYLNPVCKQTDIEKLYSRT